MCAVLRETALEYNIANVSMIEAAGWKPPLTRRRGAVQPRGLRHRGHRILRPKDGRPTPAAWSWPFCSSRRRNRKSPVFGSRFTAKTPPASLSAGVPPGSGAVEHQAGGDRAGRTAATGVRQPPGSERNDRGPNLRYSWDRRHDPAGAGVGELVARGGRCLANRRGTAPSPLCRGLGNCRALGGPIEAP